MLLLTRDLLGPAVLVDGPRKIALHIPSRIAVHSHKHRHRRRVLLAEPLPDVGEAIYGGEVRAVCDQAADVGVVGEPGAAQVILDRLRDVVFVVERIAVRAGPGGDFAQKRLPVRPDEIRSLRIAGQKPRRVLGAGMAQQVLGQAGSRRVQVGNVGRDDIVGCVGVQPCHIRAVRAADQGSLRRRVHAVRLVGHDDVLQARVLNVDRDRDLSPSRRHSSDLVEGVGVELPTCEHIVLVGAADRPGGRLERVIRHQAPVVAGRVAFDAHRKDLMTRFAEDRGDVHLRPEVRIGLDAAGPAIWQVAAHPTQGVLDVVAEVVEGAPQRSRTGHGREEQRSEHRRGRERHPALEMRGLEIPAAPDPVTRPARSLIGRVSQQQQDEGRPAEDDDPDELIVPRQGHVGDQDNRQQEHAIDRPVVSEDIV